MKPFPGTHKKPKWTRDYSSKAAGHAAAYQSNAASCGYCHGSKPPAENKFCMKCHKLAIPHPSDFKDTHKQSFQDKKLKKSWCYNCHKQSFCDGCHHNYTGGKNWKYYHDDVVKKSDPQKCFECHKETYCSYCHVRLIH
jgi:hypothetical protein